MLWKILMMTQQLLLLLLTYRYFRSVLYDDDGEQVEDDEDITANGPHPRGDDDSFSSPLKRTRREYDSK